jgi:hypothetical protein
MVACSKAWLPRKRVIRGCLKRFIFWLLRRMIQVFDVPPVVIGTDKPSVEAALALGSPAALSGIVLLVIIAQPCTEANR